MLVIFFSWISVSNYQKLLTISRQDVLSKTRFGISSKLNLCLEIWQVSIPAIITSEDVFFLNMLLVVCCWQNGWYYSSFWVVTLSSERLSQWNVYIGIKTIQASCELGFIPLRLLQRNSLHTGKKLQKIVYSQISSLKLQLLFYFSFVFYVLF